MSEFDKLKIGFVLALLAAVFALHPIIHEYRLLGYRVIGLDITVWNAYIIFALSLSMAVYLFAINVMTEKPFSFIQKAGNIVYAVSLLIVPCFFISWLGVTFAVFIGEIFRSGKATTIISDVGFVLIGVMSGIIAKMVFDRLVKRDLNAAIRKYEKEEVDHILRAEENLSSGFYDGAVFECADLIKYALHRAIMQRGLTTKARGIRELIDDAIRYRVIPENARPLLDDVLEERNHAAHSIHPIEEHIATHVVDVTKRILSLISKSKKINDTNEDYEIDA